MAVGTTAIEHGSSSMRFVTLPLIKVSIAQAQQADNRQFEGRGNLIFVLWLHEDTDAAPVDGFFYQVGQQLQHQATPPDMSFGPEEEIVFQDAELSEWASKAGAS